MCSDTLNEPVAWLGPVVMNTREELLEAFNEIDNGKFIKQEAKYENIDPFYSESNMAHLNESEQQYRDGRVVVKTMKDLEAMADE